MTDGSRAAAGKQMNALLARLTGNAALGAIIGAIVTAVIQSPSVTTVLMAGFASAGFMTLVQSVGVIFGANVGTTITARIVAFNTTALAFPLIASGFFVGFVWKQGFAELLQSLQNPVLGMLAGAVFAALGAIVLGDQRPSTPRISANSHSSTTRSRCCEKPCSPICSMSGAPNRATPKPTNTRGWSPPPATYSVAEHIAISLHRR